MDLVNALESEWEEEKVGLNVAYKEDKIFGNYLFHGLHSSQPSN